MRRIDSIIDRFVDDLLALVREATAERLAHLLAHEAGQRETRGPASKQASARRRRASTTVCAEAATPAAGLLPPEASAEITNPQWLLAMGSPAASAVDEHAAHVDEPSPVIPEWDAEGPASSVRDSASPSPVRLRENESLARVSGAGVVIRRAAR